MTSDIIIDDNREDRTRTLVLDIPMPDLLHALFKSDHYMWHTRYNVDIDVMIGSEAGIKSCKLYPHDGDTSPRSIDDYFIDESEEDEESEPANKVGATFVIYDDAALVDTIAEILIQIASEAPHLSEN